MATSSCSLWNTTPFVTFLFLVDPPSWLEKPSSITREFEAHITLISISTCEGQEVIIDRSHRPSQLRWVSHLESLTNDHGTPLFGWDHRKVHGNIAQSLLEGKSPHCKPKSPLQIPLAYLQELSHRNSLHPSQHYPYLPCETPCTFFNHWKMLWVVVQNYPRNNLKWTPVTLSTNEKSRILKSHGLMAFVWTWPETSVCVPHKSHSSVRFHDSPSHYDTLVLQRKTSCSSWTKEQPWQLILHLPFFIRELKECFDRSKNKKVKNKKY